MDTLWVKRFLVEDKAAFETMRTYQVSIASGPWRSEQANELKTKLKKHGLGVIQVGTHKTYVTIKADSPEEATYEVYTRAKKVLSGLRAVDVRTSTKLGEVSPPGWKGTVKAMKKKPGIDNPYALAWSMKNKGAKPHYKMKDGKPVKKAEAVQTLAALGFVETRLPDIDSLTFDDLTKLVASGAKSRMPKREIPAEKSRSLKTDPKSRSLQDAFVGKAYDDWMAGQDLFPEGKPNGDWNLIHIPSKTVVSTGMSKGRALSMAQVLGAAKAGTQAAKRWAKRANKHKRIGEAIQTLAALGFVEARAPSITQAKVAVKKFRGSWPADKIEIDGDTITVWADDPDLDSMKAKKIGRKIAKELGSPSITSDSNKTIVWYKRRPNLDLDNVR